MDDILEQMSAEPGDWCGMKMAKNVTFNYVWLNFGEKEVVDAGRVEVSKDGGATWQTVALKTEEGLIHGHVDTEAGFNAVRWVNASDRSITFKIRRFNVDLVK